MVEAAKAFNPFTAQAHSDISNHCPHMARLGFCPEPAMCFLIHTLSQDQGGAPPTGLSAQAKAFNPFAAGAVSAEAKSFVPREFP